MVNRAILAGELPSAAARAAAATSPPQSGLMTVRISAGSAPVCLWGKWRGSVDAEQQKSVSGSASPGKSFDASFLVLAQAGACWQRTASFISSGAWPGGVCVRVSPACATPLADATCCACAETPHLDDLRAQLPAVPDQVAQRAGRIGARLLLVVRQQLDQGADRGAQRIVQRWVVEAGVADGKAGKLPAARGVGVGHAQGGGRRHKESQRDSTTQH